MRIWSPPRLTRCWITRATCCPAGFVNVPGQKSILVRGLLTGDTRSLFLMADLSPTSAARCSELRGRELVLQPGFCVTSAGRQSSMVTQTDVQAWADGLDGVVDRIAPRFGRVEPRRRA